MKLLFGAGLVFLVLGVLSFFVPIPHTDTHSMKIGDAHLGVQTTHDERIPPLVSALLVAGGAGMMIAGGRSRT
jgi:hypothetical protein